MCGEEQNVAGQAVHILALLVPERVTLRVSSSRASSFSTPHDPAFLLPSQFDIGIAGGSLILRDDLVFGIAE